MIYIPTEQFDSINLIADLALGEFRPVYYQYGEGDTHVYLYDKDGDEIKIKIGKDSDETSWFIENKLSALLNSFEEHYSRAPEDNTNN